MATNRSVEKEDFWRLAIAEQQESGTTIKAFCAQQGLATHSFSWWKRQIRKRDRQSGPGKNRNTTANGDRMAQLIPVIITEQVRPASGLGEADGSILEIVSPTGFTFRIKSVEPPPHLTRLLDAITACDAIGGQSC